MARILVVDDEETTRIALASALVLAGFEAQAVCSSEAASEARKGFDLVIVDLMLHGTNGFELSRRLRDLSPEVRVILTSEYHFSEHQLARLDCGAIAFVPRPYSLEELSSFLWSKLGLAATLGSS